MDALGLWCQKISRRSARLLSGQETASESKWEGDVGSDDSDDGWSSGRDFDLPEKKVPEKKEVVKKVVPKKSKNGKKKVVGGKRKRGVKKGALDDFLPFLPKTKSPSSKSKSMCLQIVFQNIFVQHKIVVF